LLNSFPMKKCLLSLLLFICLCYVADGQAPKREVRGTWIATYTNIDWPKIRTEPVALQRAALIAILDHHKATGINTIYFQIRSQCDAMYQSDIEPWSADLTGTQGKAPTELSLTDPSGTKIWDPLKFIIQACHERGMELHAWMNPYRAINNYNGISAFAPNHVARQHPEWLLSQGTLRILDPGKPAARAYIKRVVADVVSRYDIDGIHFDDYFYPPQPPAGTPPYNDDATYNADPRGILDRGDWRRDNVNLFVHAVSDTINLIKPWVKFGVSPSGIYRNSTNPAIGSATSGLQHYVTLFADSRKWLQQGWIDYLAPQVYWYIGQPGANYAIVVPWWNNNAYGRHIYIGMAGYKVNDPIQGGPNWAIPTMIPSEVRLNRSYPNVYGQAIYNTSSLLSTTKLGFRDSLRTNFYKYPALLPRMPWRDDVAPDPATALTGIQHGTDSVELNWIAPTDVANEFDKVKKFVIYRSANPVIDLNNPANIVTITTSPITHYIDKNLPSTNRYFYAVTSIDRFNNESLPSNVTDYLPPVIACVTTQNLEMDMTCKLTLPDYRTLVSVSDDVSTSSEISVVQSPAVGTVLNEPGSVVVTVTATDASGKSSSCSFTVIGTDRSAPVITGTPDDISVGTGEESVDCSTVVTWIEPSATDNCTTPITYFSRSHAPGDVFAVGTTSVTYVFRDAAGNESSASFDIEVEDNTAPVVLTRDITRTLIDGAVTISPSDVNNGSSDNCEISSLTISPTNFTCENIGENIVTLTIVDVHGNENSGTAVVTIIGGIPQPLISVSRDDNTLTGLAENTIALGYGAQALTLSVIDATGSSQTAYTWSPLSGLSATNGSSVVFTPSTVGSNVFTVEAKNEFGCSASAQVIVNVIDVRCGSKGEKVQVCQAAGNPCVATESVAALLQGGATLTSCGPRKDQQADVNASVLTAYPNPFENKLSLQVVLPFSDEHIIVEIHDVYGGKAMRIFEGSTESGQAQNFTLSTNELRGRVFLVRLVTSSGESYDLKVLRKE
jgi:uncharacterized lipoprotein YddW (UPF0748 family)